MDGINPTVLMANLGILANIFESFAIAIGLSLFLSGLFKLKRYSEMRTFMSYQLSIASPLLMLIAGISLLCFPLFIKTALINFWSTSSPLKYQGPLSNWELLIPPIIVFVRLIGVAAFIRGLVLFSRCGSTQTPPGMMGKALLHFMGGLLCVHILGTMRLLKSIIGLTPF